MPVHKSTSAMFRLGDLRRIRDLYAGAAARRNGRNGKGTPVDYVKTVPPVVFPRQAGIYVKAPNPNAAKLFAEWLISDRRTENHRLDRPGVIAQ